MADAEDRTYRPDALIAQDIDAYLERHRDKGLLRFITCGSVDDGKSTLIGRLLYDSRAVFEDQLGQLESDSARVGTDQPFWTPHSAYRDPAVALGAPSRYSIELRATCLWF